MMNNDEGKMAKVLLVASDRIEMTLMRYVLEKNGCEVDTATNGFNAVKKLDAASAPGREDAGYDLLVTSEELPVMKGEDLCRAAKKSKEGIKVIGMAIDSESEMPREKSGYDYFIGGVFKIKKVADALNFVFGNNAPPPDRRSCAPNVQE